MYRVFVCTCAGTGIAASTEQSLCGTDGTDIRRWTCLPKKSGLCKALATSTSEDRPVCPQRGKSRDFVPGHDRIYSAHLCAASKCPEFAAMEISPRKWKMPPTKSQDFCLRNESLCTRDCTDHMKCIICSAVDPLTSVSWQSHCAEMLSQWYARNATN